MEVESFKEYITNFLLGFDQWANTWFGNYADESLSAHSYRRAQKGKPLFQKVINTLFFWQKDHCYHAYLSEVNRTQFPKCYRDEVNKDA